MAFCKIHILNIIRDEGNGKGGFVCGNFQVILHSIGGKALDVSQVLTLHFHGKTREFRKVNIISLPAFKNRFLKKKRLFCQNFTFISCVTPLQFENPSLFVRAVGFHLEKMRRLPNKNFFEFRGPVGVRMKGANKNFPFDAVGLDDCSRF